MYKKIGQTVHLRHVLTSETSKAQERQVAASNGTKSTFLLTQMYEEIRRN